MPMPLGSSNGVKRSKRGIHVPPRSTGGDLSVGRIPTLAGNPSGHPRRRDRTKVIIDCHAIARASRVEEYHPCFPGKRGTIRHLGMRLESGVRGRVGDGVEISFGNLWMREGKVMLYVVAFALISIFPTWSRRVKKYLCGY